MRVLFGPMVKWVLDNGAIHHMTYHKFVIKSLHNLKRSLPITLQNGSTISILHAGAQILSSTMFFICLILPAILNLFLNSQKNIITLLLITLPYVIYRTQPWRGWLVWVSCEKGFITWRVRQIEEQRQASRRTSRSGTGELDTFHWVVSSFTYSE